MLEFIIRNLPKTLNLTSIISIIEKVHLDNLNVYLDTPTAMSNWPYISRESFNIIKFH